MKLSVGSSSDSLACDVLVIGGGLAGTMAAITAAQSGARVLMLVKGRVADSGSSARAGGIIAASFGHTALSDEVPWDSAESHVNDTLAMGCELCSEPHVRALADDVCAGIQELERLGVEFSKTEDGRFHQLKAPGNSRPRACSVVGAGFALMTQLRSQLLLHNVQLIENTAVTCLLVAGQRVTGAQAINLITGAFVRVTSHATILATGGAAGLFPTISGDKTNTGDGLAIAYDAGAQLANFEFVEFTLIYRVKGKTLKLGGLAPFLSRGCTLVNKHGEKFLERYYARELLERLGRAQILQAVVRESIAARDPIYLDCTTLPEHVWTEFERSQGSLMLKQIWEAGCDYRSELIEVLPAAHSILAGLVTDANAKTSLTALWAAGECATGVHGAARLSGNGLAACLVFGRRAGKNAATFSLSFGAQAKRLRGQHAAVIPALRSRLSASNRDAMRVEINSIAEECLGVVRNGKVLTEGLERLRNIGDAADITPETAGLAADIETRHLVLMGELMVCAALKRKESRGLHYRTDSVASKDSWRKWLVVEKSRKSQKPRWAYRKWLSDISRDEESITSHVGARI